MTPSQGEATACGGPALVVDRDVLVLEGGRVLLGGVPGRLLRLAPAGAALLRGLLTGGPVGPDAVALAGRLVAGGLAHPLPGPGAGPDVVVVVPVRDRAEELDRCLRALGDAAPVLVVDDGSTRPADVAAVCRARGAGLLALPVNAGPGPARSAGTAATTSTLVAYVDSDCTVPPGWLAALAGHFEDASVGAVAPRVRSAARGRGLLARWAALRGPLDLGERAARVRPGGRVSYVPTAALLARRSALPGRPFDPALRYGEDVDLVWRLHDAGWQVRYDPRCEVRHAEPERWGRWLARRHAYGTSAAPLAARHGDRLVPLVLPPGPAAAVLLGLAGRPLAGTAAAAASAARLALRLRRGGLAPATAARAAVRLTAAGTLGTAVGLGGAGTVVTGPVLLALLVARRTRRAAALALLAPPLLEWAQRRPALDPARWTALHLADDLAYATGVWRGCLRERAVAALGVRTRRPG